MTGLWCDRCPDGGIRSGSYRNGGPREDCARCGRSMHNRPWTLTADRIREFLADVGEAVPDLTHDEVSFFTAEAIRRALGDGAEVYGLNGFLDRELRGEPEAELLDTANYAIFEALKQRKAVADGRLDPIKADEDYRALLSLAVDALRLHERWRAFWVGRG